MRWSRDARAWLGVGLVAAAVVIGVSIGGLLGGIRLEGPGAAGPTAAPAVPTRPAVPRIEAHVEIPAGPSEPVVFVTPSEGELPETAAPLAMGDFGVEEVAGGVVRGTLAGASIRCDGPGILRIETREKAFLAGIPRAGSWDCEAALAQWRRVSPTDDEVGLRYTIGAGERSGLTLVNGNGVSMLVAVSGAWEVPN